MRGSIYSPNVRLAPSCNFPFKFWVKRAIVRSVSFISSTLFVAKGSSDLPASVSQPVSWNGEKAGRRNIAPAPGSASSLPAVSYVGLAQQRKNCSFERQRKKCACFGLPDDRVQTARASGEGGAFEREPEIALPNAAPELRERNDDDGRS